MISFPVEFPHLCIQIISAYHKGRMESNRTVVFAIALAIFALLAAALLLIPIYPGNKASIHKACISHLKQSGTMMQVYLADFDDRFPASNWADPMLPYLKQEEIMQCPLVVKSGKKWGYAMNMEVMGKESKMLSNPTVLFFETDALGRGVIANLAAQSRDRHKKTGSHVCYADSTVKFIKLVP